MSQLEQYETSDSWKEKVRNHLLMNRKNILTNMESIKETQRFSFDLSTDLQKIIQKKMTPCSQKENVICYHVTQKFEKNNISDESFEAMETICNKSVSDPNSTLFKFMHGSNQSQILNEKKKRIGGILESEQDFEFDGLSQLCLKVQQDHDDKSCFNNNEVTQIENIEAPSRFWENDTLIQTPPIKMMDLLRPSTIQEETNDPYLSLTEKSFKSAIELTDCELSSSCYETASSKKESFSTNTNENFLNQSTKFIENIFNLNQRSDVDESVVELLSDDEQELLDNRKVACDQGPSKCQSLCFNDTLEEVEYLMLKGEELKLNDVKERLSRDTFKKMPSPHDIISTPTKKSLNSKSISKSKQNAENKFALDIKPIPKMDIFKKPNSKYESNFGARRKEQYSDVISPISTYIKKTGESRLIKSNRKAHKYEMNSSAFHDLEIQSRQFGKDNLKVSELPILPASSSLPKKAYISSQLKQVTDERNFMNIPGGNSIQKYLATAKMSSIIHHNGKASAANLTSNANTPMVCHKAGNLVSRIPKHLDSIANSSYANLSLVTGDVSLYTIKDAHKL